MTDIRVIACLHYGRMAYIVQTCGMGDRVRILTRNHRRRWGFRWVKTSSLSNLREKAVPPEKGVYHLLVNAGRIEREP